MPSLSNVGSTARAAGVVAGAVLGLLGAFWAMVGVLQQTAAVVFGPGRASVDELLTAISAAAALALLVWVTLGLLVSVLAVVPGPWGAASRRLEGYVTSAVVRRWAALLLGAAITSSIAPAGAAATLPASSISIQAPAPEWVDLQQPAPALTPDSEAPAPTWTPAPTRALPPVSLTMPRQTPETVAPTTAEVTVRRGDTLWDLAAAHLPAEATDAEIAASWQQWYRENRDTIGPDPDLILPGQILTVPASESVSAGVSR